MWEEGLNSLGTSLLEGKMATYRCNMSSEVELSHAPISVMLKCELW